MGANAHTKAWYLGVYGLGLISVWLTLSIGFSFLHCFESMNWPKAKARILLSGVATTESSLGTTWTPDVAYEYQVNGTTYHSTGISYLMPIYYRHEQADAVRSIYPEGQVTAIAYDPHDPGRGVLAPGVPSGMWKQLLIPIFFWGLIGYLHYELKHPHRRVLLRSNLRSEKSQPLFN